MVPQERESSRKSSGRYKYVINLFSPNFFLEGPFLFDFFTLFVSALCCTYLYSCKHVLCVRNKNKNTSTLTHVVFSLRCQK